MIKKSYFDLAREQLKNYYLKNDQVPPPMMVVEWYEFLSHSTGRSPSVVRDTTSLLLLKGFIKVNNGKVYVDPLAVTSFIADSVPDSDG